MTEEKNAPKEILDIPQVGHTQDGQYVLVRLSLSPHVQARDSEERLDLIFETAKYEKLRNSVAAGVGDALKRLERFEAHGPGSYHELPIQPVKAMSAGLAANGNFVIKARLVDGTLSHLQFDMEALTELRTRIEEALEQIPTTSLESIRPKPN